MLERTSVVSAAPIKRLARNEQGLQYLCGPLSNNKNNNDSNNGNENSSNNSSSNKNGDNRLVMLVK